MMTYKMVLLAPALLLAGCASVPPLSFSVPQVGVSQIKQAASLVSTSVTVARPDEAKGKIEIAGAESDIVSLWKSAIDDALTRMAVFRDDAPRKLSLTVRILRLDLPAGGVAMTTHAAARYELIDRNTGDIVFTSDIATDGRVNGSYAFSGAVRGRESASRSVQNNILAFLQQLETADLSKAAFPAPTQAPAQR